MKSFSFLIVFLFFAFRGTDAQEQNIKPSTLIYFKSFTNGKGPVWNKRELDSFLLTRTRKDFKLIPKITGTEQNGDTLFYKIVFEADMGGQNLVRQPLPDFNFKDIKGRNINSENLKGKPIVINFWFASCIPCIAEMPELNKLKEKYKDSGIVFLSMTFETKNAVVNFLKWHQFNFTVISDVQEYCSKITQLYPITLFVDKQGIIKSTEHLMPPLFNFELSKRIDELDPTEFEKNIDSIK